MILSRFAQGLALSALVFMALPGPAALAQDYAAVLAAPDRSDADRQNDAKRQALELLTFSGPKTGWHVLDMGAGGGYSTERLPLLAVVTTHKPNHLRLDYDCFACWNTHANTLQSLLAKSNEWQT